MSAALGSAGAARRGGSFPPRPPVRSPPAPPRRLRAGRGAPSPPCPRWRPRPAPLGRIGAGGGRRPVAVVRIEPIRTGIIDLSFHDSPLLFLSATPIRPREPAAGSRSGVQPYTIIKVC